MSLGVNGRLSFWDPERGHELRSRRIVPSSRPAPRSLEELRQAEEDGGEERSLLRATGLAPDGSRVALALEGFATVWNTRTFEREMRWELPGEDLSAITVSPEGRWVASGDRAGRLCIWPVEDGPPVDVDPSSGTLRRCTLPDPEAGAIVALAAGRGDRLAVGHRHRVELGSVAGGEWSSAGGWAIRLHTKLPDESSPRLEEQTHLRFVRSLSDDTALATLSFSPSGDRLAAGWNDGVVDLLPPVMDGAENPGAPPSLSLDTAVTALAFSPEEDKLLVGGASGALRLFGLTEQAPPLSLMLMRGDSAAAIRGVAFDPGGRRMASADAEGVVRTWARVSGYEIRRMVHHGRPVAAIRWANERELWSVVPSRPAVYAWNVPDNLETVWIEPYRLEALERQAPPTVAIASPEGERVAIGFGDGGLALWSRRELLSGDGPRAVWQAHGAAVTEVAFEPAPSGALLSGAADGTVKRWHDDGDPRPWSIGAVLDAGAVPRRLVFAPNSSSLLVLCSDAGITLLDLATGESVASAAKSAPVFSARLLPAGGETGSLQLMAAFADGLHEWSPGSQPVLFQKLDHRVRSLDFTPGATALASTQSANGAIEVWAFGEQGTLEPRHLLLSGDGDRWLACEKQGACRRNDDGTLLLERETDQPFAAMLPVLETTPELEVVEAPEELPFVPGNATPFTVKVHNLGPGPAPWVTVAPNRSTPGLLFHPPETTTWLAEGAEATLLAAVTPTGEPRPYLELAVIAAHNQARDGIATRIPSIRLVSAKILEDTTPFAPQTGISRMALFVAVFVLLGVGLVVAMLRRR